MRNHPLREPRQVIYRDKQWPIVYAPGGEYGPVSWPQNKSDEPLEAVIARTWDSWEKNNEKQYQRN